MKLIDLEQFVTPPAHPVDCPTASSWMAAEQLLQFPLPPDHYELCCRYGSGEFRSTEGHYVSILNPTSATSRASYANLQESYREVAKESDGTVFPQELFPSLPGLSLMGVASSRVAMFYMVSKSRTVDGIAMRTHNRRWRFLHSSPILLVLDIITQPSETWEGIAITQNLPHSWSFISEILR